jgi:ABC-type multidrug transport system fused ATPase/permease subunit
MTFRYPDGEGNVLEDITYDFPPHSRTAVVGETGVGKSTMIKLMLSLLRPTSGSISIYDGDSSVEVSPMTRANFAYVPQGNTLFSGTIRENLLLGNPDATEEMLWDVLGTAAADFVKDLPGGLDASCGEHGTGLSEGQAQRIAIARGLLRPGSILLLDEFSSSLDPDTEALLMRRLMSVSDNKTLIFITHREKIAEYCDRVLSLKGNRQA